MLGTLAYSGMTFVLSCLQKTVAAEIHANAHLECGIKQKIALLYIYVKGH